MQVAIGGTGNCPERMSLGAPRSAPITGSVRQLITDDRHGTSPFTSQASPCVPPAQAAMAAATGTVGEPATFLDSVANLIEAYVAQFLLVALLAILPGSSAIRQALLSPGTVTEASTDRELANPQIQAPSFLTNGATLTAQFYALSTDGTKRSGDTWPSEGRPAEALQEGCRVAHKSPGPHQLCQTVRPATALLPSGEIRCSSLLGGDPHWPSAIVWFCAGSVCTSSSFDQTS